MCFNELVHDPGYSWCSDFFFQAEDGIRDLVRSRGLGDVYKRQDDVLGVLKPHRKSYHRRVDAHPQQILLRVGAVGLSLIHI